jgi:hypothetical protein
MNPSEHIDKEIANHPDWRGQKMAEIRGIIRETVPDVTEAWKWMGTPTWSHNGILCICNVFKDMVKVTFINGAKLGDVDGLFNAELGGTKWRAIKIFHGDKVNASGLRKLLLAAWRSMLPRERAKRCRPLQRQSWPRQQGRRRRAPGSRRSQNARPPARPQRNSAAGHVNAETGDRPWHC